MLQLVGRPAGAVFELVDAIWNRATPWGQMLTEACQEVSKAIPGIYLRSSVTVPFVRENARLLLKACKHLSRFGSVYRAFRALWQDVVTPRTHKVLGTREPQLCSLCGVTLPSRHALAAHIHRKHSVVNCLTQFTLGTVCLWCNVDHHSTDRLKYHLGRSLSCMHGLRVVVGPAYVYGSDTKRKGARGHRGLPPIRLAGPVNATPAQRLAAAEGRPYSEDELRRERLCALGVEDVYAWPSDEGGPLLLPAGDTRAGSVSTSSLPRSAPVPSFPAGGTFCSQPVASVDSRRRS